MRSISLHVTTLLCPVLESEARSEELALLSLSRRRKAQSCLDNRYGLMDNVVFLQWGSICQSWIAASLE